MDARTAILTRARDAIARSQRGPARPVPRDYIRVGEHAPGSGPVVADMVDKLEDYDAVVRTEPDDAGVAEAIDALLGEARVVVVPAGLPEAYKRAAGRGREVLEDSPDQPIATLDLDHVDAVVTCSRLGISISGTIVLDGEPDQGRRAITLVPDTHVCVVRADQVVQDVPDAVAISEAVNLAAHLSTDESPNFVSGLLTRISQMKATIV